MTPARRGHDPGDAARGAQGAVDVRRPGRRRLVLRLPAVRRRLEVQVGHLSPPAPPAAARVGGVRTPGGCPGPGGSTGAAATPDPRSSRAPAVTVVRRSSRLEAPPPERQRPLRRGSSCPAAPWPSPPPPCAQRATGAATSRSTEHGAVAAARGDVGSVAAPRRQVEAPARSCRRRSARRTSRRRTPGSGSPRHRSAPARRRPGRSAASICTRLGSRMTRITPSSRIASRGAKAKARPRAASPRTRRAWRRTGTSG